MILRWSFQADFIFKPLSLCLVIGLIACTQQLSDISANYKPDIQGHRGCRGLFPENTIPAFLHAIDLGVNTLEMDVVISKDSQVIVSHEAFFHPEITTKPDGTYFKDESEARKTSIFHLRYEEIKKFDVGLKPHPRFPVQKKMALSKPLLNKVILECENHAKRANKTIRYNIEIKCEKDGVGVFQPEDKTFAELVLAVLSSTQLEDKTTIQSFEPQILNEVKHQNPSMKTVLLVENALSTKQNLALLDHKPYAYSPAYKLVSGHMVTELKEKNIKLIPWTVNDELAIQTLMQLGVDGIISDYPDKVINIYNQLFHAKENH